MRKLIIAGAALFAAAPALAQPGAYHDEYEARDERPIDARDIGRMANAMDRMVGAILDLPVGGIASAAIRSAAAAFIPGNGPGPWDERDDPYAERAIRAGIPARREGSGAMTESFARMLPVLRRSIDEMSRSFEAAMGGERLSATHH